tara:strand:- start:188 stop:766 length:579 start_codon:yes stop_codon:yes gene_type:complete
MIDDFIIRYAGALTETECKEVIKKIDYFEDNHLLTGENTRPHEINHNVINLAYDMPHGSPISNAILSKFDPCIEHYLKTFSVLGQSKFLVYDCKLKKIPSGAGFHQWHYENSNLQVSQRHFAIQLYLNDDFEGGETEFLYQNRREPAVAGDVIIFPCGYTHVHRGNPPIGGTKYLATSWGWMQANEDEVVWK